MSDSRIQNRSAGASPNVARLSDPTGDSGLRCPACEYNLTGLFANRCPECGAEFDAAVLRERSSLFVRPATPWDRGPSWSAFLETWRISLWLPRALAQDFPRRHSAKLATAYSILCYLIGAAIFGVGMLFVERDEISFVLLVGAAGACACWTCETVIAALLGLFVRPTFGARGYHFWRGVTHYCSGYSILTGCWGAVVTAGRLDMDPVGSRIALVAVPWLAAAIIFCWWVTALIRMVFSRSQPGLARWIVCGLIAPIGIGAIYLGFGLAVVFVIACADFFR